MAEARKIRKELQLRFIKEALSNPNSRFIHEATIIKNTPKGIMVATSKKMPGRVFAKTKGRTNPLVVSKSVMSKLKPVVKRIEVAGSIRRNQGAPKDVDILVEGDPEKVYKILKTIGKPVKKGSQIQVFKVRGTQVDIYFTKPENWGASLFFLTGPNFYNIAYRNIAKKQGLKLNQYGLYNRKTGKLIASRSEHDIYKALGRNYKPPERRGLKAKFEMTAKAKKIITSPIAGYRGKRKVFLGRKSPTPDVWSWAAVYYIKDTDGEKIWTADVGIDEKILKEGWIKIKSRQSKWEKLMNK